MKNKCSFNTIKMSTVRSIFIIVIFLLIQACSMTLSAKTIELCANVVFGKNILEQSMFKETNVDYLVKYQYDLLGKRIELPLGTRLVFESDGLLMNGVLVGNNSDIKTDSIHVRFMGVCIDGTWKVNNIYSTWFDMGQDAIINTKNFKSICTLTSDKYKGNIYITSGTYPIMVDEKHNSVIMMNSNSYLQLDGTLTLEPNNLPYYGIIDVVEKYNVKITGKGTIIGDVSTHTGTNGEWGMGIIVRSSQNVTICDLTIKECWGDCIYLGQTGNDSFNSNVTINNVTCDAGRRQGMSIIAGKNILVQNCDFINTGTIKYTSPGAGIDIEPNYDGTVVRNIIIDNSRFIGNKGQDIATKNLNLKAKIIIRNCYLSHSLAFWENSYNITIKKCDINSLNSSDEISNIRIKESIIRKKIPVKVKKSVKIDKCTLYDEGNLSFLSLSIIVLPLLAISISGFTISGLKSSKKVI